MGYSPASAIPLSSFGVPVANIPMNTHKFTGLLDGTVALDSAGWDQLPGVGTQYAYVVSGCVWTADSPGSTLACSMSAGTVMIGGLLYSLAAVTSRSFTASVETYIDVALSGGAAAITYTTVANWGISPALASSGTLYNTIRIAVISSGSSAVAAAGIGQGSCAQGTQGNGGTVTIAGSQPSSTVAAGSNGQTIGSLTSNQLVVASTASFVAASGLIQVTHAATGTYTLKYTGVSSPDLTGLTAGNTLSGAGTVSTGDAVVGICPIGVSDTIGNVIYPTVPYPHLLAATTSSNSDTSTLTSAFALPRHITAFVVPAGVPRNIQISLHLAFLGSSATAGTNITIRTFSDNAVTPFASAINKVPVASDSGLGNDFSGAQQLQPGTYYAQAYLTQAAAGTLTYGTIYATQLFVESL